MEHAGNGVGERTKEKTVSKPPLVYHSVARSAEPMLAKVAAWIDIL